MRCNPSARWGPGTTKERVPDTESSKQLKSKMEEMLKEREKQNAMWQPLTPETQGQLATVSLGQKK
jgi:hypothetical protein